MNQSWQEEYTQLKEFLKRHPEIEVTPSRVSIPSESKEEFYRLFDVVRLSFVKTHFSAEIQDGVELSQHYKGLRTNITQTTGLEVVESPGDLKFFLEDPADGLARFLFNPLYEALAGEIDADTLEKIQLSRLREEFTRLFRDGYQRFIVLGIIRLLEPDRSYHVPAVDGLDNVILGEGHENPGQWKDNVPEPAETGKIYLEQHPVISFIVPRALLHSRRTGSFVALHYDFHEAEWTARKTSENVEWLRFQDIKQAYGLIKIRPDLMKKTWYEMSPVLPDMAIYTAKDAGDLALVADYRVMLRPAVNVEIMESSDWFEKGSLTDIKRHLEALRPRQGAFIACRKEFSQEALKAAGEVKLIKTDYDLNALDALIKAVALDTT